MVVSAKIASPIMEEIIIKFFLKGVKSMKEMFKTFGVAFAYATGIMAGMCVAPTLVEKAAGLTKKLIKAKDN